METVNLMKTQNPNQLTIMCHPYLFALKEGQLIKEDMLDYSLLLLQRSCNEVIKSPKAQSPRMVVLDSIPMFISATKI
jgi:hypothetical protein